MEPLNISIIGAGNLGTRLALVFHKVGHQINQICSRTPDKAYHLSRRVNASLISRVSELEPGSDLYLLCVPDRFIPILQSEWPLVDQLVCHTSGSTAMGILADYSANYGVFFPLQTFSYRKNVSFRKIPLCIEANTAENLELIRYLGSTISGDIRVIPSEDRQYIHMAAVIAGNFSNFMYVVAEEILREKGYYFDILRPLINETSRKALKISPSAGQTGPAVRNDQNIIGKHLSMLRDDPEKREIYELISREIYKKFHKD
ncbi:MAG: DUF2520 domain-containing protein [Bacteroidetes bacterium]|nr:DUF2520 domain-containing protein [Bacteroidota bacterium]